MEWWQRRIPDVRHPGGTSYATCRKGDLLRVQGRGSHAGVNRLVGTKQLSCTKVRMDVVVRMVWKSRERNEYMHGGVKRKIWAGTCEW